MPVTSLHPGYQASALDWRMMRDLLAGERAVKEAATEYLPMPSGQTPADYDGYRMRAPFEAACSRTLDGLLGMLFRKPPTVEIPTGFEPWIDNITLDGTGLNTFARKAAEEILAVGRVAMLVDMGVGGGSRPYVRQYTAETIRNWRIEIGPDATPKLVLLVLEEQIETHEEGDPYATEHLRQLRVLRLDGGRYIVELWRPEDQRNQDDNAKWVKFDERTPMRVGRPLDFLPVVIMAPDMITHEIKPSPLRDLAALNLAHYRVGADHHHALHMVALPTPWVATDSSGQDETPFRIGSGIGWKLPIDGKAGMLEVTGNGIESLQRRMEHIEERMAAYGARLLESQKRQAETASALQIRQSGESSVLADLAEGLSVGMSRALRFAIWWSGNSGTPDLVEADVAINRDFVEVTMDAQSLTAMVGAYQMRAIPWEVLIWNLRRGELIPDHLSDEDIRNLIDTSASPTLALLPGPSAFGDDSEDEGERT